MFSSPPQNSVDAEIRTRELQEQLEKHKSSTLNLINVLKVPSRAHAARRVSSCTFPLQAELTTGESILGLDGHPDDSGEEAKKSSVLLAAHLDTLARCVPGGVRRRRLSRLGAVHPCRQATSVGSGAPLPSILEHIETRVLFDHYE